MVPTRAGEATPQQENCFDCGVFACQSANAAAAGRPF
eukprot:gene9902-6634_t